MCGRQLRRKTGRVITEFLIFECDAARFGIRASDVSEVVRAVAVAPAPHTSETVLGTINLRGELVPVISTRMLLGLHDSAIDHRHQFIILCVHGSRIALHVDQAIDLIPIERGNGDSADRSEPSESPIEFTAQTELGIISILSAERLLPEHDARVVQ